jgi:hypothetical protein
LSMPTRSPKASMPLTNRWIISSMENSLRR